MIKLKTIPLYISGNVAVSLADVIQRLCVLRSTNEFYIQKSAPQKIANSFLIRSLSTHDSSNKSVNLTLKSNDIQSESESNSVNEYYRRLTMIEADRQFLHKALTILKVELEKTGKFSKFLAIMKVEQDKYDEARSKELIQETSKKETEVFLKHISRLEKSTEREVKELNLVLANLKNAKQELFQKSKMEYNLLVRHLSQETRNLNDKCNSETANLIEEIATVKQNIVIEERANKHFQCQLQENCKTLIVYGDEIAQKYHSVKEEMVTSINKYQKNCRATAEKYNALLVLAQNYTSVVADDKILKEQLGIEAEKENFKSKTATKIQNWWRCMIVLKNLVSKQKKVSKKAKKGKK